jgi:ribonuclease HIII
MNTVELNALKIIKHHSSAFIKNGFKVSTIDRKDYNYEIVITDTKDKIKLLVFFGKKGNKFVLQGNPDHKLYKEIHDSVFGTNLFTQGREVESEPDIYIGTDESGKGDYFGPLVVCGVIMNASHSDYFKQIGVKDSKLIDDYSILIIADKIKKVLGNEFSVLKIKPLKYNELQQQFGNINKLLGWAHSEVIKNLLQIQKVETVICDKFGKPEHIDKYFTGGEYETKIFQYTKAERFLGVAAASIIARAEVVNWFKLASEKLQYEIPLGAASVVDRAASHLKKIYGSEFLSKLVKLHFKNSSKLK